MTHHAQGPTSADRSAVAPGAVPHAAERGPRGRLQDVAGAALVAHCLVEGEVGAELDAVGWCARISTADD